MLNQGLLTSKSDLRSTPMEVFEPLNNEFKFELDVCAIADNAKCSNFYTPEIDGLSQPWKGVCWCNPPYGRSIGKWVKKAYESSLLGATVVCLLPSRTDTKWFHDYVLKGEVRFLPGRIYFVKKGYRDRAPFPSLVVVFRGSQ